MVEHRPRTILREVDGDNSDSSEASGELHQGIGVLLRATASSTCPGSKQIGAAGANAPSTFPQRLNSDSDGPDAFWESEDDCDGQGIALPGV